MTWADRFESMSDFNHDIILLDTVVAGTTYCDSIQYAAQLLSFGVVLEMRRDAANPYDEHAIALYVGEIRIGWVPRSDNQIISRLMDAGKTLVCRVQGAEWINDWLKVSIRISMLD